MTNKELLHEEETYIFPSVAAKMLHVDPRTLQRMAERGEVAAIKLPSGHRRYLLESVEAIRAGSDVTTSARRSESKSVSQSEARP